MRRGGRYATKEFHCWLTSVSSSSSTRVVLRSRSVWTNKLVVPSRLPPPATSACHCHPRYYYLLAYHNISCAPSKIRKSIRHISSSSSLLLLHNNNLSSDNNSRPPLLLTIAELEFRVSELERGTLLLGQPRQQRRRRLTKYDVQNMALPLLYQCASLSSEVRKHHDTSITQLDKLARAQVATRILQLCLIEVEARRVYLWDWLHTATTNKNSNNNNNNNTSNSHDNSISKHENDVIAANVNMDNYHDTTTTTNNGKFSPTAFWNDTPHPTKEMYSIVLVAWKHVVESYSYFSIISHDAMKIMESSAQQTSSLLALMEDEYSSDSAFIHAYNTNVPRGSYTLLRMGAVLPDVRNYSTVIGTWGQCIDGSILRPKNNSFLSTTK